MASATAAPPVPGRLGISRLPCLHICPGTAWRPVRPLRRAALRPEPWQHSSPKFRAAGALGGSSSGPNDRQVSDTEVTDYVEEMGRRTTVIRFTCNLCGGRSERMCSPRALKRGSVFAQCQHCEKWHTVTDHLNIADEYRKGPDGQWIKWTPEPLPEPTSEAFSMPKEEQEGKPPNLLP